MWKIVALSRAQGHLFTVGAETRRQHGLVRPQLGRRTLTCSALAHIRERQHLRYCVGGYK